MYSSPSHTTDAAPTRYDSGAACSEPSSSSSDAFRSSYVSTTFVGAGVSPRGAEGEDRSNPSRVSGCFSFARDWSSSRAMAAMSSPRAWLSGKPRVAASLESSEVDMR